MQFCNLWTFILMCIYIYTYSYTHYAFAICLDARITGNCRVHSPVVTLARNLHVSLILLRFALQNVRNARTPVPSPAPTLRGLDSGNLLMKEWTGFCRLHILCPVGCYVKLLSTVGRWFS